MKTCLYNFDRLKPRFYFVKLGFTGVYIIFHISGQNIDCGYSLEPPRDFWSIWKISPPKTENFQIKNSDIFSYFCSKGGSNEYHNLCFDQKYEKQIKVFI